MYEHFEEVPKDESRHSFFKSLPKPQRAAFLFLSALSLGVLILWGWQFNSRLNSPFYVPGVDDKETNGDELAVFEAALINLDTDGDGLTDNEERNLYGTSPYLDDSDSDNISDRAEIEAGTNPNCAAGQQCNVQDVPAVTNSATGTIIVSEPDASVDAGDANTLQTMMSGQADAAQLRALLLDSGADAAMLQSLSDAELLQTYQEMLASQGSATQ